MIKNVKLKNRRGEYLEPYTENVPTASTSKAGKVKLDSSPIAGSNNAIASGAVHTAFADLNGIVNGIKTTVSGMQVELDDKVSKTKLQVVDCKPANPDNSTFYFVKE